MKYPKAGELGISIKMDERAVVEIGIEVRLSMPLPLFLLQAPAEDPKGVEISFFICCTDIVLSEKKLV